jgi:hypothetical protein
VEIFPMQIRSIGFSISSVVNYAVMVLFSQVSPIGLNDIGWKYYIFFICSNLAMAVVVILFYPETQGKSLEQMDELFGDQMVPHALDDPAAAEKMHGNGSLHEVEGDVLTSALAATAEEFHRKDKA